MGKPDYIHVPNWLATLIAASLLTSVLILGVVLTIYRAGNVIQTPDTALLACGEGWYHTLAALNEALIRLEGLQ